MLRQYTTPPRAMRMVFQTSQGPSSILKQYFNTCDPIYLGICNRHFNFVCIQLYFPLLEWPLSIVHQRDPDHYANAYIYRIYVDVNEPLVIGVLPSGLKQLTFGHQFNQPLMEGVLSSNLEQLTFGSSFNQPLVEGVLPSSLEQLTFDFEFNQQLEKGVLPSNLKQLTFGD